MRSRLLAVALASALLAAPAVASAHTAPSADVNNRYLKATLLSDQVRLSFTLFFGDRPGAAERRRIDTNHDGRLDEEEGRAFGERVLAELAPGLAVTVDGKALGGWRVTDVGLGSPTVQGGALSLDLVLVARYSDPRATTHTLAIEDGTVVDEPGESETRLEESPGVRLVETHRADRAANGIESRFAFVGNPRARGEREVVARFTVPPGGPNVASARLWPGVVLLVAAGCLALGAVRVWGWRRRRPTTT